MRGRLMTSFGQRFGGYSPSFLIGTLWRRSTKSILHKGDDSELSLRTTLAAPRAFIATTRALSSSLSMKRNPSQLRFFKRSIDVVTMYCFTSPVLVSRRDHSMTHSL